MATNGFVTATQLSCDASQDGRRLGGHRRCVPLLPGLGSEDAQRWAGDQMALNIECVVDGGMQGEEALSRSCGLEPLHLSLASADRLVRNFRPVVLPQASLVVRRQTKLRERRCIDRNLSVTMTVGAKPCFLRSLRISFRAAALSRPFCTRMSS